MRRLRFALLLLLILPLAGCGSASSAAPEQPLGSGRIPVNAAGDGR